MPNCVVHYITTFATESSKKGSFHLSQYWHSPTGCLPGSTFSNIGSAASYGPIAYLPSVAAVGFLQSVGAPLPLVFFGGRMASLLAFIVLFCWAIRVTPIGKQVLFVLGALPTTLLLASSYSADPMTISLAVLSVALVLRCCISDDANWHTVLALFLVLLGLGLTKPTLVIFAPLLFLVPVSVMGPLPSPRLIRAGGVAVILGATGLWYLVVRNVLGAPLPLYGIDPHKQLRLMMHNPIGFIEVLVRTFFEGTGQQHWLPGFYYSIGFNRPLVGDNVYASTGVIILGSVTLWYAFQLQLGAKRTIDHRVSLMAWMPIGIMIAGIVIVEAALYVYGTPVGFPVTLAQGRYLYPLIVLPLITIGLLRSPRAWPRSTRWIVLGSVAMPTWLVFKVMIHDLRAIAVWSATGKTVQ